MSGWSVQNNSSLSKFTGSEFKLPFTSNQHQKTTRMCYMQGLTQLHIEKNSIVFLTQFNLQILCVCLCRFCVFAHSCNGYEEWRNLLAHFRMACSFYVLKPFWIHICILPPVAVRGLNQDILPDMGTTCSGHQSPTKTLNHVLQFGNNKLSRN